MAGTIAQQLTERRKDLVKQALVGLQEALNDDEALGRAIRVALPVLKSAHQLSNAIHVQAEEEW